MKYAAKYLFILSLLGATATGIYAQEVESNVPLTITNVAQFDVGQQIVTLNGHVIDQEVKVEAKEDTFFLPARWLAEKLLASYVSLEEEGDILRIRRQGTLILIQNGAQVADINGEKIALKHKVYSVNGRYMISVEDLETLFEIKASYDETTDILNITGEDRRPNDKPQADFYFMKKRYVEGQEIIAVNTSRDPNQDEIVATKWSVGTEDPVIADQLSEIFTKPKAGTYTVGLQVQDGRGLWSDWTYKTIEITENQPPVIKTFTTDKASYQPGENITFDYTYTNEEGETITNEKWMYRKSTQEAKLAVLGKPNALFTEGDYIVTLQIDDAAGKRSKVVETTVHIEGEPIRSEFDYFFKEGKIGDRIDNFDNNNYRTEYADAKVAEEGVVSGTLIMSDSPETVKRMGVLYEDTMEGKGRILIHHLNQISDDEAKGKKQKLALLVSNDGEETVNLTLSNEAIKGPSTDITRIGQKVVYDYLAGTSARTITLNPGEKQWIYSQNWTINQCISGMLDVEVNGAVRFSVAAIAEDITLEQIDDLERLPADGVHISGSFDTIGKTYVLQLDGSQPTKLLLGDKTSEEWIKGIDVRTGTTTENKGNFGVSYYVTITAEEDMGIFLNSRGGGIQGAIKWEDGNVYNVPTQGMLAHLTTRAAVIGTIKKGETKTFEYILPNGSSAPVLIGFVPASQF